MIKSVSLLSGKSGCTRVLQLLRHILCLLFLVSCEEIMDVSFTGDSTTNLVVEGSITTEAGPHRVVLSYTGDFFEKPEMTMASGAKVTISDGTSTFILHEQGYGIYLTDDTVKGSTGKLYTLDIILADGRQFTASDYINPVSGFDSIGQTSNHKEYMDGYGYDVLFYGNEYEPSGDHYMFLLYTNDVLYSDTITEVAFANDDFINGMYVRDYPVYRIREIDMNKHPLFVTLEMHSVNRQYYEFMLALMTETIWKGLPWDGPPANVPGNVSNGARGYFRASDVKRQSRMFRPTPRIN